MGKVLIDFSIFPIDQGESLSQDVAKALDVIDRSGLPYQLHPMGTIIEGDFDACMSLVRDCFEVMRAESDRVLIQLKVDYRKGREGALESKTASIERQLGRKLCT